MNSFLKTLIDAAGVHDPAWSVRVTPTGLAILLLFAVIAWRLLYKDQYSVAAQRLREGHLDEMEDDDSINGIVSNTKVVRLAVAHMRTELGLLSDTPANRLVASDVARRFLKERGLRPTHISQHFTVCVEVYFMRSSNDEWLRKVRESTYARQWRRLGGSTL